MNKYYITTSIPYVNADPHIGFALEAVQTDTQARYQRLKGNKVRFLSGTDENALKNVQAAEKAGKPTQEFVGEKARNFEKLKKALNLSWDDFIRTTEQRHKKGAIKLWEKTDKEDIYKKTYRGLYCVGCEAFYEREDLDKDGECFEHPGKKLDEIEEENYFFRLSKYQGFIEDVLKKGEVKVFPEIRKNEVMGFVKRGLVDFSISRSKERAKNWGIEVPGDASQVIYVWYDALANYITALGYADGGGLFREFWLENENRVHVIGKGISRFHAIYWLAMLKSVGLPLPTEIFIHGYVTSKGQKISKSLGNVIDPFEQVGKFGTDAVRYYLLREIPSYGDGDYTEDRFREVFNADLANGLGNLVSRVAKLCERVKKDWKERTVWEISQEVDKGLKEFKYGEALAFIWQRIAEVDRYLADKTPWKLEGEPLEEVLGFCVDEIRQIAFDLQPFLPLTAEKIMLQFGAKKIGAEAPLFLRLS